MPANSWVFPEMFRKAKSISSAPWRAPAPRGLPMLSGRALKRVARVSVVSRSLEALARTEPVTRREADSCRLHSRYGLAFPIWRVRWRRSDKDALTIALAAAILFP